MPPPPPAGLFDARFANGRMAGFSGGEIRELPIGIRSANYPVTLRWENAGGEGSGAVLRIGPREIALTGSGKTVLTGPADRAVLVRSPSTTGELPEEYALEQNYPNPFNPVTTIRYALPEPAHVRLKLYNLLGQGVASLVDGMQDAGYRSARFDGSSYPSGIYIYRI